MNGILETYIMGDMKRKTRPQIYSHMLLMPEMKKLEVTFLCEIFSP